MLGMEALMNIEKLTGDVAVDDHNQRRETRTATNVAARIVLADMTGVRECRLLDISKNGAKLDIGDWTDVPKDFYLLVRVGDCEERLLRWCERRWIVGNTMGVRFRDAPVTPKDLLAILPPDRDKLTSN